MSAELIAAIKKRLGSTFRPRQVRGGVELDVQDATDVRILRRVAKSLGFRVSVIERNAFDEPNKVLIRRAM